MSGAVHKLRLVVHDFQHEPAKIETLTRFLRVYAPEVHSVHLFTALRHNYDDLLLQSLIDCLRGCGHITTYKISECKGTGLLPYHSNNGLWKLLPFLHAIQEQVECLCLKMWKTPDTSCWEVLKGMRKLKTLHIECAAGTLPGTFLTNISMLSQLQELSAPLDSSGEGSNHGTLDLAPFVSNLMGLTSLTLTCPLPLRRLIGVSSLTGLQCLAVEKGYAVEVADIENCHKLTELRLSSPLYENVDFLDGQYSNIKQLALGRTCSEALMLLHGQLAGLELSVTDERIVQHVVDLTNLTKLTLADSSFRDRHPRPFTLMDLTSLRNLVELTVHTGDAEITFVSSQLPLFLQSFPQLKRLTLPVSDRQPTVYVPCSGGSPLVHLALVLLVAPDTEAMEVHWQELPSHLTSLSMKILKLKAPLTPTPTLEYRGSGSCCPLGQDQPWALSHLEISSALFSDAFVEDLVTQAPNLRHLRSKYSHVCPASALTEKGLGQLGHLRKLTTVDIDLLPQEGQTLTFPLTSHTISCWSSSLLGLTYLAMSLEFWPCVQHNPGWVDSLVQLTSLKVLNLTGFTLDEYKINSLEDSLSSAVVLVPTVCSATSGQLPVA